ncbi:MAG: alpha/beta fold hydrolase [Actinomycetota bacterium]
MSPNVSLHHRLDGPPGGPVILLSNSLATTIAMWEPQLLALTRTHRVLRYDHPGHGGTAPSAGTVALRELALDVASLLERLGIDRVSGCGLSLGGMVLMQLASDHPKLVDRLVVASTSARLGAPAFWKERADLVRGEGLGEIAETIVGRWFTPGFAAARPDVVARGWAMVRSTDPGSYAALAELLAGVDLTGSLGSIGTPTLAIAGADDVAIPPDHTDTIADGVPDGSVLRIPDAAHLVNIEQPAAFTRAVMRHLEVDPGVEVDDAHDYADPDHDPSQP